MISGTIVKVEPTQDNVSITIKVGYDHYLEAASMLMKAKNNNEGVCVLPAQTELSEGREELLRNIRDNLEAIREKVNGL
ncbi:MAG: hypothetical protein IT393_07135 [Nitrospirae bacterium]|nr:hypothetical protein [Nitrospirota bacterium]